MDNPLRFNRHPGVPEGSFEKWFNGEVHTLVEGVDFFGLGSSLAKTLRGRAENRGIKHTCRYVRGNPGVITFQVHLDAEEG